MDTENVISKSLLRTGSVVGGVHPFCDVFYLCTVGP